MHPYLSNYSSQNQGYYVFIHEDNSPNEVAAEILTPGIDEGFEWDEELVESADREDEDWSSLYRWYAHMLEQTEDTVDTSGSSFKMAIDKFAKKQRTAAHYAAEQGHVGVLRLLIQTNSKIDSCDIDGYTPLHLAIKCGQISVVRVLLEAAVEINRYTLNVEQFTPLHIAAVGGHLNIIDLLLLTGAILEPRDSVERTPLQLAVVHSKVDAVIKLIQAGSNVNIEDIQGKTPLCEAVYQNIIPVVETLLSAGARIQPHHYLLHYSIIHKQIEIMQLLIKYGSNVNLRDDDGDSPLLLAIRSGEVKLVNILVNNGAMVDYPNSLTGSTPLHEAVGCSKDFKTFEDIFSCLRSFDVDLNAICFSGGDTPLFRAILLGHDEIAKLLIKHGADVNLCSMQHCVLDNLTLALSRKSTSIVRLLVLAGANPPPNWERVPRPLTHFARLVLRANMPSKRVLRTIQALPIPATLKEFLMFKDED